MGDGRLDPAPDVPPPQQLTPGQHVRAFLRELTVVVVGAVVVAALLRAFVGQMFLIPSVSMEPALRVDDRVLVEKVSGLQRGQVVVFADPGGWLSGPPTPERGPVGRALQLVGLLLDTGTEHLVKRLVGLPGDVVACCDAQGRISVNGHPVDEAGYLAGGSPVQSSAIAFAVTVPAGRIFVLGDNREASRDSRCHLHDVRPGEPEGAAAFVPVDLVVGRAVAVAWPVRHAHWLRIPATVDAVPAAAAAPAQAAIDAGPEASC